MNIRLRICLLELPLPPSAVEQPGIQLSPWCPETSASTPHVNVLLRERGMAVSKDAVAKLDARPGGGGRIEPGADGNRTF